MTDPHRDAWKKLRRLRLAALAALAALLVGLPCAVAVGIFAEPLLGDASGRVSVFIAVLPVVFLVRLITSFERPDCRKPFSTGGGTGVHLTNKRCVSCGLKLGE